MFHTGYQKFFMDTHNTLDIYDIIVMINSIMLYLKCLSSGYLIISKIINLFSEL